MLPLSGASPQAHLAAKNTWNSSLSGLLLFEKTVTFNSTSSMHHPRGILHSVPLLQQGQCQLLFSLSRIPCARHCVQTRDFDLWTKGDKLSIREKIAAHGESEKSESSKGSNVFQLKDCIEYLPSKTKLVKHKAGTLWLMLQLIRWISIKSFFGESLFPQQKESFVTVETMSVLFRIVTTLPSTDHGTEWILGK